MPGLSDVFGKGSIGEQLLVWGFLNQLITAATAPGISEIQQSVYTDFPVLPIPPELAATLVQRGYLQPGDGIDWAAKSGIGTDAFHLLVKAATGAPPTDALLAGFNRGILGWADAGPGEASGVGGLRRAGLGDEWFDLMEQLAVQIPTVQEVMNAYLEGQIERGEALDRYTKAGGDPTWFQQSYDSQGEAPTPVEALEMLNRGLIGEGGTGPGATTYEQAFLEGPWRNKWLPAFLGLRYYLPPPRTVTALRREGSITTAQATKYFQAAGLDADLTAIYLKAGSVTASTAAKELSQSQIIALYEDKLITAAEATTQLVAHKYSASDAHLLLALADTKEAAASVKSAVTRIRTLYLTGKNSATATIAALHTLGLDPTQVTELIATWDLEAVANVKTLTAAEYAGAVYYGIMDQATAIAGLMRLGYDAYDAWVVISIRLHAPQPDEPAGGSLPPTVSA